MVNRDTALVTNENGTYKIARLNTLEGLTLVVRGNCEKLLPLCTNVLKLSDNTSESIDSSMMFGMRFEMSDLKSKGCRVQVVAIKRLVGHPDQNKELSDVSLNDLTLVAIIGLQQKVKRDVKEYIEKLSEAGIAVIMMTGSNSFSAKAVAVECGIIPQDESEETTGSIIEGSELNDIDESNHESLQSDNMIINTSQRNSDLDKIYNKIAVLCKATPPQKSSLVEFLKQKGHKIGVIGASTSDAPALKSAHVGFSLGMNGTETAKSASDIILLDDDFSTVFHCIRLSRHLKQSVLKSLQFQIIIVFPICIICLICAVSVQEIVISPLQMVWMSLSVEFLQTVALNSEELDRKSIKGGSSKKDRFMITGTLVKQAIVHTVY